MPFNTDELNQGVQYWRQTNWPQDFHNGFYQRISGIRAQGLFDQQWWNAFLPILRQWRATRPRSSEYLTERAGIRFDALRHIWNHRIVPVIERDIETIEWEDIAQFVMLVAEIKNVSSPVFCSKLCHFLAPHIFPIVDNAAMGNPFDSYELYFNSGRQEWHGTEHEIRGVLMDMIADIIGPNNIAADYPKKCKIIELCFIGRNQNNR